MSRNWLNIVLQAMLIRVKSYREKIGLHIYFHSAHFNFFYFFYSYTAKSAHSLELECV